MFVMMGEILLRAGITERMYDSIVKWLGWLPGGLMHSNIGSSALFAATSGSSGGNGCYHWYGLPLPQIKKRGYNESLFLGTVAAGGTLGILIPPSINLILYGLLTNTSVPELYLAGFFTGVSSGFVIHVDRYHRMPVEPKMGWRKTAPHLVGAARRFAFIAALLWAFSRLLLDLYTQELLRRPKLPRWAWWRPCSWPLPMVKCHWCMMRQAAEGNHAHNSNDYAYHHCCGLFELCVVNYRPNASPNGFCNWAWLDADANDADDRCGFGANRVFYGNLIDATDNGAFDNADCCRFGF